MSTETKPIEEQTTEELAASFAAEQARVAAEEAPPAETVTPEVAPEKFEFTATDGTVYTAESQEELFKKVTSALDHTKLAFRDRERQIHELRQKPVIQEKPTVKPASEFSKDEYFRLMDESPLKAREYEKQFDPDYARAQEDRAYMEAKRADDARNAEAAAFYQATNYGKIETPELNAIFSERMKERGRGVTADAMKLTYYELKEEGKIPTVAEGQPPVKRKAPPASASGSGGNIPDEEPDYRTMSMAELKAYMRKQGMEVPT